MLHAILETKFGVDNVMVQINSLSDPLFRNASWKDGAFVNFTVELPFSLRDPKELWETLWQTIVKRNYSIGGSDLYVNPYQSNRFGTKLPIADKKR